MSYLNEPFETVVPKVGACAWGGTSFQLGLLEHQLLAF